MNTSPLLTFEDAQRLVRRDPDLDAALARVATLDFSMLCNKLVEEHGWTPERCLETEGLYRKFLALNVRYFGRKICPTKPIDEFWHAHILDTRSYARDCYFLFGEVLHHFPYFGMRGPDDRLALEAAFRDSVTLFIEHFGMDPTIGDVSARACSAQRCP